MLLDLITDTVALLGSSYEKANTTVHLTNVNCVGGKQPIDNCTKDTIPLNDRKTIYTIVIVAGVPCMCSTHRDGLL